MELEEKPVLASIATTTTQQKATFTTVKDKRPDEKPADVYKDIETAQVRKSRGPTEKMLRLNRALQKQRRGGKSAG